MFDISKIETEIKIVNNLTISNEKELEVFKTRYFSKNGVLPSIYDTISKLRGVQSDFYLDKMLELRHSIDKKIKEFILSH